ncbi:hypothetical protein J5N97_016963 [Dioscorea zingiberensis]|uniref:Uncharacterized protein n=1 Tax=Dioscorea zingiberensis TaxID=325984 RepID=A0A9D5CKE8_9LILI|nr:hypothetical protein J5N97_016963 [Dioscorea zingiberensis]
MDVENWSNWGLLMLLLNLATNLDDAKVISAGILSEAMQSGYNNGAVKNQISMSTAHLLHENLRMRRDLGILDDESASALRRFCLTYYNIWAVLLELALTLDAMRHLDYLPQYH